jgi:hypothetical protein
MRKSIIVFLCVTAAAFSVFANGNAEKLTSLEGTVVLMPSEGAQVQLMLRTAAGADVIVDMPVQEMLRLEIRAQERLRVDGVFVGAPAGEQVKARILAKVVNANGKDYKVEKPVQLTTQDRARIRAYESEQTRLQARDQTQAQSQTQLRENEGSGSGSSVDKNSGNK